VKRNHTTTILLLLLAQTATAAETRIFEWHESNGVVSYSDTPPPPGTKGVTSREIDSRTLTPAQRMAAITQLEHIDATEQAAANLSLKELAAADLAINSALKRLSDAERNLRAGRIPLGSDRIGTTDGHSRLRVAYFERLAQLDSQVHAAHAAVEAAYRLRDSIAP
jgi:hypothetical protein